MTGALILNERYFIEVAPYAPAANGDPPSEPSPPAATSAIEVRDPSLSYDPTIADRPNLTGSLAPSKGVFAGQLAALQFAVELKGSGTPGVPPIVGRALRACGFAETIVVGTSVSYALVNESLEQVTLWAKDGSDGYVPILGAVADYVITQTARDIAVMQCTFMGHAVPGGRLDSASLPSPTFEDTVPDASVAVGLTFDGTPLPFAQLTINGGVTTAANEDGNSYNGYGEPRITQRNVTGQIDPERLARASLNVPALVEANGNHVLRTTFGSTPGNQGLIEMGNVVLRDTDPGDRNGVRTDQIDFQAVRNSAGVNDVVITFT